MCGSMPGRDRSRHRPARHGRSRASRLGIRTRRGRRLWWARAVSPGRSSLQGLVSLRARRASACRAAADVGGGRGRSSSTTTDEMGRFVFSALPAGRFNLSASKPGHVSGTYGQRQAGRPGTPIQLADGQTSAGAAANHTRRSDHRHRARRKRRGHSRNARARASLRHAERAAHAAIGRERSDRRPRRVPHLRAAARRLRRVRHAAQQQSRPRCRPSGGVAATPPANSHDGAAGGGPGAGAGSSAGYPGAHGAGSKHAAGVGDRRCHHWLRARLLSGHDGSVERRDGNGRTR